MTGEIQLVTDSTAYETGELLARMHTISEREALHVDNRVLFNPLTENDLFSSWYFEEKQEILSSVDPVLFQRITDTYTEYLKKIAQVQQKKLFAVQGDISQNNLYRSCSGELGVFDFNNSGDNDFFYDAVMQGVFEARLMDYPEGVSARESDSVLRSFFQGYTSVRPFTSEQIEVYPFLYAMPDAFWRMDILFEEDSLDSAVKEADMPRIRKHMQNVFERLSCHTAFPLC